MILKKKLSLLFGLIFLFNIVNSMEEVPESNEYELGVDIESESNPLLTLPTEIILHVMSFLEMNDSAFRHLRLYTINIELTSKEVEKLLWRFYRKVINKANNMTGVADIIRGKFECLDPSFKNYEKFLHVFESINLKLEQFAKAENDLLMKLQTDLNQRNYAAVKTHLNSFFNGKMHGHKQGNVEADDLFLKELYLIINETKASIFLPVVGVVFKDESLAPLSLACQILFIYSLLGATLFQFAQFYKGGINLKNSFAIASKFVLKLIKPYTVLASGILVLGTIAFYQDAPSKTSIIDLLDHKLDKIQRKMRRLQLEH